MADERYEAAGELFRVLAAPVRLQIIEKLIDEPATVGELVAVTGQSQPLISQHLRVLRAANLIRAVVRGRERLYSLSDQHVAHIVADAIHHVDEDVDENPPQPSVEGAERE